MVAQRLTLGVALALSLGTLGACRAHVRASGHGHAHAEPVLVWIDGVWVVEDYHEPVFYHSHYYWRYHGGVWYRSNVHSGGWVRIDVVPDRVRVIDRPERYVRWRAEVGARKHTGKTPPPDDGPTEVGHDDHPGRGHGPPDHAKAHGLHGTQPGHNKDDKAEMKEEKHEAKAEAKAEKEAAKEAKHEAKSEMKAEKKAEKAEKHEAKTDIKAEKKLEKAEEKAEKAPKTEKAEKAPKAEKAEKAPKAEKVKEEGGGGKKDK